MYKDVYTSCLCGKIPVVKYEQQPFPHIEVADRMFYAHLF